MNWRFWGPLLLAGGVAGFWWLGGDRKDKPLVEEPVVEEKREGKVPKPAWTVRHGEAKEAVPQPAMGKRDEVSLPAWHEEAMDGEAMVFFEDDGELDAFVEAARAAGFEIRGISRALGAVRVGGELGAMTDLLDEAEGVDYNYRVRVPAPPVGESALAGSLQAVGGELLDLLGVEDREGWRNWGEGVRIAVLDSGWQGHQAMDGKSVREMDFLEDAGEAGEFSGHGTAVAGLIGSANPLAPGIAPGSELLSVRVLDGEGQGNAFTLAEGIVGAVDAGAQVINMSLGSYADSRVLRKAVEYATERGALLVAAAGNDGARQLTYPAAYGEVIGVSAVDALGQRAGFANAGAGLDLAAPGYQMHALWGKEDYVFFGGTSAASAVVAGLAGRVWQGDLGQTAAEVRGILEAQANAAGPPGRDGQYGAGIVDAGRLERRGQPGFTDIALADLYPALEQADGASFPLYASFENRGTSYLPAGKAKLEINGLAYHYNVPGLEAGAESHVAVSVPMAALANGSAFVVRGEVSVADSLEDRLPENNAGEIRLRTAEPANGDGLRD